MTRQVTISEYEAEIQKQEGVIVTIRADRPGTPSTVASYCDRWKPLREDQQLRMLADRIKLAYPGIMFHMVMGDGRAAFTPKTKIKAVRESYSRNIVMKNPEGRNITNFGMMKTGAKRTI
jgi:hypothetical protein